MSDSYVRPPSRRAPLGEATRRINNTQHETSQPSKKAPMPHHESHDRSPPSPLPQFEGEAQRAGSPNSNIINPRMSAISKGYAATDSNRSSRISTTSTNTSDGKKRKSCIGPWQLGKTLGSGATARVRLARHTVTGQIAAVKIVQKKFAQMSQAGSLKDLDRADALLPDQADGVRRMPIGIEREVAIMKLIQHPNIMRLYDIWENRTEIYLVLEYVDGGELFGVITANGKLTETEAITYLRQILAGVGYCHSLNICHRDLKPENILLTKAGQIKVADFGMAALHQAPGHKLETSCGSPHYAAPEVVKGGAYRGDKTDIWSLGIILYATLAGRLPFDTDATGDDLVRSLVPKIKRGVYEMPEEFSPEAADLVWRMLQVDPKNRITMTQIWRHPLVQKYKGFDKYDGIGPPSPSIKEVGRIVLRRSEISPSLVRYLRAMWHRLSEKQLIDALLSKEPNDQKMFYSLLLKYQEAQLENYVPELTISASDYHHHAPLTKTYSTCNFPQPKTRGHKRQTSRFTVISNAAETERSYDPFKASRPQHLDSMRPVEHAKITIHRRGPSGEEAEDSLGEIKAIGNASRTSTSAAFKAERGKLAPSRAIASRSSIASSTRSKNSGSGVRATVGHKRVVKHRRRRSSASERKVADGTKLDGGRHSNHTEVTDNERDSLHPVDVSSSSYIRSKKTQGVPPKVPLPASKAGPGSQLWTEDVRQLSSSLAMDCDEAFKSSNSLELEAQASDSLHSSRKPSPLITQQPFNSQKSKLRSFDDRPLPPPPARSESTKIELLEARKLAEQRKALGEDSSKHVDRMVSHIDRLMQTSSPERRTSSAPVESKYNATGRALPSIYEAGKEDDSPHRLTDLEMYLESQEHGVKTSRIASAPEPRETRRHHDNRFMASGSGLKETIRVVQPSSPVPVKVPAPLTIRKKSSYGGQPSSKPGVSISDTSRSSSTVARSGVELRQQYRDLERISEDHDGRGNLDNESITGTVVKKKPTWFKRNSKQEDSDFRLPMEAVESFYVHPLLPAPPKKKGFNFGRYFKKRKPDMVIGETDFDDDNFSIPDSTLSDSHHRYKNKRFSNQSDPEKRQIGPQQNWFAKLFNVKPASKIICFSVSDRRARQEIVTILKEWKRYGIRELQVDKKANRVFGKVVAKNFLDMKEVAFAAEVMKVIEHGRKSQLSIARFTQEFGAASSFHKVVETLEGVLKCRGMLVGDDRKRRMMIKTLNA
ncbi:Serine threonine-kinase HSL1 [Hyphodiscus hymeniophilus]|uniref:non-specific serine/threonine protein kinase n=1 Tax=Hyphodiscus hymeniophilus TaxID=353542 RepID=A0A9P7AZK8_9HELO|nr:Serine threonine-kinase HSL1 [Hyphodiscus hymeniophilus]